MKDFTARWRIMTDMGTLRTTIMIESAERRDFQIRRGRSARKSG